MSILSLKYVSLRLGGREILKDLSLDIWEGHIHAIIGPNGAGKSTMANVIMGLSGYTEHEGDIIFEGQSLKGVSIDERARRGITLAWQEPARFEGLTVRDFIQAPAKDKSEDRIYEVLDQVGLKPDQYINRAIDKSLSGGERKRLELASILAMEPKLILMDEPDSGIDVGALERIFDVLTHLKEKNVTVLMITHSLTVLRQAEHAFLICCGQMADKGSVEKIARYFENKCIPCDHPNPEDFAAELANVERQPV